TADPATANPAATATALSIEAHEFSLSPSDLHAAAGSVAIHYTNAGAIQHTLVIDGVAGFKLDVPKAGDVDTATVKLEPGTYTLYCYIAGPRQAGMEDHLNVGYRPVCATDTGLRSGHGGACGCMKDRCGSRWTATRPSGSEWKLVAGNRSPRECFTPSLWTDPSASRSNSCAGRRRPACRAPRAERAEDRGAPH